MTLNKCFMCGLCLPEVIGPNGESGTEHIEEIEDDAVGPAETDLDLVLAAASDCRCGVAVILQRRHDSSAGVNLDHWC